jgi:hypothetical protein
VTHPLFFVGVRGGVRHVLKTSSGFGFAGGARRRRREFVAGPETENVDGL